MRFLFVGSHFCPPASFRQVLAGLPLPSASGYPDFMTSSHRGLSPHKLMPMSGVHPLVQATRMKPRTPDQERSAPQVVPPTLENLTTP